MGVPWLRAASVPSQISVISNCDFSAPQSGKPTSPARLPQRVPGARLLLIALFLVLNPPQLLHIHFFHSVVSQGAAEFTSQRDGGGLDAGYRNRRPSSLFLEWEPES